MTAYHYSMRGSDVFYHLRFENVNSIMRAGRKHNALQVSCHVAVRLNPVAVKAASC